MNVGMLGLNQFYKGMKMNKVYIAGKLNDSAVGYIKNLHNMMYYAELVRRVGFSAYVPCLDMLMGIMAGDYEYADYFDNNIEWLKVSDAVFLCPGWESSEGVKKEIEIAKENNKVVFDDISILKKHFDKRRKSWIE